MHNEWYLALKHTTANELLELYKLIMSPRDTNHLLNNKTII